MLETSARLLRLLSLLQARRDWSGPDLADRLGVSARTVRRDVDRLRQLGYPVHAGTGTAGGDPLGGRGPPPPPVLRRAEAPSGPRRAPTPPRGAGGRNRTAPGPAGGQPPPRG